MGIGEHFGEYYRNIKEGVKKNLPVTNKEK